MIKVEISSMTSPGPKKENQDDLAIWNEQPLVRKGAYHDILTLKKEDMLCTALADGVSSAKEALLSSKNAIDAVMEAPLSDNKEETMAVAMNKANEAVSAMDGSGACTLNYAILDEQSLWLANIGDSPIYLIRDGQIHQIAQMQTAATVKRNLGIEDITLRDEHTLVNFVGNPYVDGAHQMYVSKQEIIPGDIYILCSDGISDALGEEKILKIALEQNANAQSLIDQAGNDAEDNISAIMICIQKED